jgi:hypothetical protein
LTAAGRDTLLSPMFRVALCALLSHAVAATAVLDVINSNPQLSIFAGLLQTTGFGGAVSGSGPYSVFGTSLFLLVWICLCLPACHHCLFYHDYVCLYDLVLYVLLHLFGHALALFLLIVQLHTLYIDCASYLARLYICASRYVRFLASLSRCLLPVTCLMHSPLCCALTL